MRILCPHCGKKSVITHSEPMPNSGRRITTLCSNPECGARDVFRLSYIATRQPPLHTQTDAMHEWFARLPEDERQTILATYRT